MTLKLRYLYSTETVINVVSSRLDVMVATKLYSERISAAAFSADLGGSSKHTSEILVDLSGEGFHDNRICS